MNNAAIISVGNELLNGNTVDTNDNWLYGRLQKRRNQGSELNFDIVREILDSI